MGYDRFPAGPAQMAEQEDGALQAEVGFVQRPWTRSRRH